MTLMFPASYGLKFLDDTNHKFQPINFFTVTPQFHVRFYNGGVWFSKHELPYMGSINGLAASTNSIYYEHGVAHEIRHEILYFYGSITYIGEQNEYVGKDIGCDFPGIYFRHFDWWNATRNDWTLMVSLYYPILLFAAAPAYWISRRRRLRFKELAGTDTGEHLEGVLPGTEDEK